MTPAKTVKRTSGAIKISPANTTARTIKDTTLLVTSPLMNKTTAASTGWFRSLEEHAVRSARRERGFRLPWGTPIRFALVTDAYGGTIGVATIEDVVETLLGEEIVDEADKIEDLQSYARPRAAGLDGARLSSIGPRVLNGLSIPRRIRLSMSGPSRV